MAENKEGRTLAPSQKKLNDARKRGETATAPEVRHAVMLGAVVSALLLFGATLAARLAKLSANLWSNAGEMRIEPTSGQSFATGIFGAITTALLPVLTLLVVAAAATSLSQGRPSFNPAHLAPKWSKLNPAAGLKRMFGPRSFAEFAKTLAKCAAVLGLGCWIVGPTFRGAETMVGLPAERIGLVAATAGLSLLKVVALAVALLAAVDFGWQRFAFRRKMRMSQQELKDEHKESDGNPEVKARQRQIGLQRARQRMMAAVPTASVVVTNPTHFAVALRYDHGEMRAPIVVAKGADRVALRIRELATEAGVPLIENKPLARALYAAAEVDRPIPIEQYAAVAEVISFVLRRARSGAA